LLPRPVMLQQPARHLHTQTNPSESQQQQQQQQAPQVVTRPAAVVKQLELHRQCYNQTITQQASTAAAAAAAPGSMTWALEQQISAAAIQGGSLALSGGLFLAAAPHHKTVPHNGQSLLLRHVLTQQPWRPLPFANGRSEVLSQFLYLSVRVLQLHVLGYTVCRLLSHSLLVHATVLCCHISTFAAACLLVCSAAAQQHSERAAACGDISVTLWVAATHSV
jgi:hypothetical protein